MRPAQHIDDELVLEVGCCAVCDSQVRPWMSLVRPGVAPLPDPCRHRQTVARPSRSHGWPLPSWETIASRTASPLWFLRRLRSWFRRLDWRGPRPHRADGLMLRLGQGGGQVEVHGAALNVVGVSTGSIVECGNVVSHGFLGLRQARPARGLGDPLLLQRPEEGLRDRIFPTVVASAHGWKSQKTCERGLMSVARVLGCTVRVVRESRRGCTLHHSLRESDRAQASLHGVGGGPAHNPPAAKVDEYRQKEPASVGGQGVMSATQAWLGCSAANSGWVHCSQTGLPPHNRGRYAILVALRFRIPEEFPELAAT